MMQKEAVHEKKGAIGQSVTLQEISDFITKGSTPTTYGFDWVEHGILFLRSECVSETGLNLDQSMYISEKAHHSLKRSEVRGNDILMTITGNVGRVALFNVHGAANINQHIARIRIIHKEVDNQYVYHYLKQTSVRKGFESIVTGQAYPQISLRQVRDAEIFLPPLPEQRAIATALTDTDDLIESLERLIAKKRRIKEGVMGELLSGERRLEGFEGEWESRKMGDDITLVSGHHVLSHHCNSKGIGMAYITGPADFKSGKISATKYVTQPTSLCKEGDVLLTVKGSGVGTIARADRQYCISRQLMAIRSSAWSQEFLYFAIQAEVESLKRETAGLIPGLSRSDVLNTTIRLPVSLPEQRAIATLLTDMDQEIEALEGKVAKVRRVKEGMMGELLGGRVRLV